MTIRLSAWLLLALSLCSCSQPAIPYRLRVLSLDLSPGQRIETDRDAAGWARTVRRAVPDLVILHGIPDGSSGADLVRELARSTGLDGTLAVASKPRGRETGPGILSRWPFDGQETYRWDGEGPAASVAISVELESAMPVLLAPGASRHQVVEERVRLKILALRLGSPIEDGEGARTLAALVPRRGGDLAILSASGAGSAFERLLGGEWAGAAASPESGAGRLLCFPRSNWEIVHASPLEGEGTDPPPSLLVVLERHD